MNLFLPWDDEELAVLVQTYRQIKLRKGGSWKDAAKFMSNEMRRRGGTKRRDYTSDNTKARWRKLTIEQPNLLDDVGVEEQHESRLAEDSHQEFMDIDTRTVASENNEPAPEGPQTPHQNPILSPVRRTMRGGEIKTANDVQSSLHYPGQQAESADELYDKAVNDFFAYRSATNAVQPGWSEDHLEYLREVALQAGHKLVASRPHIPGESSAANYNPRSSPLLQFLAAGLEFDIPSTYPNLLQSPEWIAAEQAQETLADYEAMTDPTRPGWTIEYFDYLRENSKAALDRLVGVLHLY